MTVVVDASIAAAWLLPEEDSDAAEAVIMALSGRPPVPSLFWHEARNILVMAQRRGRIVAGEPAASPQIAAGAKIFAEGVPSPSTPACMGCHGDRAAGNGPIPRLAGQHPAYLARQLEAFASKARANEIMHENSKNLTAEQISQVTAFLATQ